MNDDLIARFGLKENQVKSLPGIEDFVKRYSRKKKIEGPGPRPIPPVGPGGRPKPPVGPGGRPKPPVGPGPRPIKPPIKPKPTVKPKPGSTDTKPFGNPTVKGPTAHAALGVKKKVPNGY